MRFSLPSGPVLRLQLAADGQWETALHVLRDAVDEAGVERWLAAAPQNVALEAFVPVAEGEAFIGIRLAALSREMQHGLVRAVVRAFAGHAGMDVALFLDKIESLTSMSLFRQTPAFLELGKVNAWRSFGSVVFWPDRAGRAPSDCFRGALAAHPKFLAPSELPYAIECAFDGTLPHWCGLPVSTATGGTHAISLPAVERLLAAVPLRA